MCALSWGWQGPYARTVVVMTDQPFTAADLAPLVAGVPGAWRRFVDRYAGVIHAAVRGVVQDRAPTLDVADLCQDVFLRLCKDEYRLLRSFDPTRASLVTWLTLVARSTALDRVRRKHHPTVEYDAVPEAAMAVPPDVRERVEIPPGLLTPRQALVLALLYDRDLDPQEAAEHLGVDAQTIRSTHHKALTRLRQHFGAEGDGRAATTVQPGRRS